MENDWRVLLKPLKLSMFLATTKFIGNLSNISFAAQIKFAFFGGVSIDPTDPFKMY